MKKKEITTLILLITIIAYPAYSAEIELEKKWVYRIDEHIKEVVIKDIDNDKKPDIILSSKNVNIHEPDRVYALNNNGELMWSRDIDSLYTMYVPEPGNRNTEKIIVISRGKVRDNIEKGQLVFLNSRGEEINTYSGPTTGFIPILYHMEAIDINNNGYTELIGGTEKGVYAINDRLDGEVWKTITGRSIKDFIVTDIDDNGEEEVIAKSLGTLYNINLKDGAVNWESHIGRYTIEGNKTERDVGIEIIRVGNINPTPQKEVIAILPINIFFVYDYEGRLVNLGGNIEDIERYIVNYTDYMIYEVTGDIKDITALDVYDFNKDNLDELLIGSTSGFYVVYQTSYEKRYYPVGRVIDIQVNVDEITVFTGNAIYRLNKEGEIEGTYHLDDTYKKLYIADIDGIEGDEFILVKDESISMYEKPSTTTQTTTPASDTSTTSTTTTTSPISSTTSTTTTTSPISSTTSSTRTTASTGGGGINVVDLLLILASIALMLITLKYVVNIIREKIAREKEDLSRIDKIVAKEERKPGKEIKKEIERKPAGKEIPKEKAKKKETKKDKGKESIEKTKKKETKKDKGKESIEKTKKKETKKDKGKESIEKTKKKETKKDKGKESIEKAKKKETKKRGLRKKAESKKKGVGAGDTAAQGEKHEDLLEKKKN